MNIEVEMRSFISPEKYSELVSFFTENAKLVKEDYQETYYFDSSQDLRTQRNKYGAKIWLKKGALHEDSREEIELVFARKDFDVANALFLALGYSVAIKWFRDRKEFLWEGITVCLDYTKGYGYIVELEKLGDGINNEIILAGLREKFSRLEITNPTSKEDFDKQYAYYKDNWRKLVD